MDHPGSSASVLQGKPLLYGTVHGAIGIHYTTTVLLLMYMLLLGLIGQLSRDTFNILNNLQQRMASCVKSIGNIEHEVYPLSFIMYTL